MENTVKRNHVRAVARAGPVLRALTGVALALLGCAVLAGCDKPTKPKPTTKCLLYAGMTASTEPWDGFIAVIDCETDSIIDSVMPTSHFPGPGVIVSPDGKYFATLIVGPSEIFDAATRLPVATLLTAGMPLFLPDAGILLCLVHDSTLVYDMPGFTLRQSWSRIQGEAVRVPGRQQVAALDRGGEGRAKLLFFDYVNYRAVDSVTITDAQGIGFQIMSFTFSPDGTRLYATGGQIGFGPGMVGYDLIARRTLFRQRLNGPYGHCRITPDGMEAWVTEPGHPLYNPPIEVQAIFIFDAITGTLVDTISTRGIDPNPLRALSPQDIRFVPDGSKAYVNCGTSQKTGQPILVISTGTRRIERSLFGEYNNFAVMIDIAPEP